MCYHVAVTSSREVFENRFDAEFEPETELKPYYHANGYTYPGLPVIINSEPNKIHLANWGLIPHFARTEEDRAKYRKGNLNSRSDTVFELSSFKKPILEKRCLVLADGFYESMDVNGKKYPYYIYRKDRVPFAFAGIYTNWKSPTGEWVRSFAIMTCDSIGMMSKIHNLKLRMPVILPPDKERNWLKTDLLVDEVKDLMLPLEDGILTAHPVNSDLNKAKVYTNEPWIQEVFEYPELVDALA